MKVTPTFSSCVFGLGFTWDRPRKRLHLVLPFLAVLFEGSRELPEGMEPNLNGVTVRPNELVAEFEGGACAAMAEAFAADLDSVGAENYIELDFEHVKHGPIRVTVQRKRGKTPSDVAAELRREVTELRAAIAKSGEQA